MPTSTLGSRSSTLKYNETTVAPGVNDDNTQGYSVGSEWIDTLADKFYVCSGAGTGAAVWIDCSAGGAPPGSGLTQPQVMAIASVGV